MNIPRLTRHFLPDDFQIDTWENLKPFFDDLLTREIEAAEALQAWLKDYSELSAVVSEDFGWRYIRMNCKTEDEALKQDFETFVQDIEPHLQSYSDKLDRKLLQAPGLDKLGKEYQVYLETKRTDTRIFREQNIPLFTELENLQQEFGRLAAQQMIEHEGKSLTMNQAGKFLENPDRETRRTVYEKIGERRLQDQKALDDLMDQLITKRNQVALNADMKNFRDYQFAALHRFDYTPEDCAAFHQAIGEKVVPLTNERIKKRKQAMGLGRLRPYDMSVDPQNRAPLHPFDETEIFIQKSIQAFSNLNPLFGNLLRTMQEEGYLDLDSRKGKAPGGFNYSLNESGIPFIFMNASGRHQDLETMFHEGGHAIHALIDAQHVDFTPMRNTPAEIAEVASMAMELISMDQWHLFYRKEEDLRRAKIEKLEDLLWTLPSVAKVDAFQHWIYQNPGHSPKERAQKWLTLQQEYGSEEVDYTGYETFQESAWQRILHIFEVPFYYVEYGIAQLGAVALWRNYLENPGKALEQYQDFMRYGYTLPLPELYEKAGIKFDFSSQYIGELMDFVGAELETLEQ